MPLPEMRRYGWVFVGLMGCGKDDASASSPASSEITVAFDEQTCDQPSATGPFGPATGDHEVFFGSGAANIPVPPLFAPNAGLSWARFETALDGTRSNPAGLHIVSCGLTEESHLRVVSKAPFVVEVDITYTGTLVPGCTGGRPSASCHVLARISYPQLADAGAP